MSKWLQPKPIDDAAMKAFAERTRHTRPSTIDTAEVDELLQVAAAIQAGTASEIDFHRALLKIVCRRWLENDPAMRAKIAEFAASAGLKPKDNTAPLDTRRGNNLKRETT